MKHDTVTQTVVIEAPPERVWSVLISADAGATWRGADFSTDWKVGSRIAIAARIGSKTYRDKGDVIEVDPAKCLSYSYWSRISGLPDTPEGRSVITIRLSSEGGATKVTVDHDVPPSPIRIVRGETIGPDSGRRHAEFYWRSTLVYQKRAVETALPPVVEG